MNELAFFTLAGAPGSPRDLIDEVRAAEEMGIGSAFVSERLNIKEAATICGAVGAASTRIGIATAATNHNTRHPAVTAAHAMTMHTLTGAASPSVSVAAPVRRRGPGAWPPSRPPRWRTSSVSCDECGGVR